VQPTQRLSLVPRCGTREHTGLTCGRAYGALSIADRKSIGANKKWGPGFLLNAASGLPSQPAAWNRVLRSLAGVLCSLPSVYPSFRAAELGNTLG
jgi:hypothetical protein